MHFVVCRKIRMFAVVSVRKGHLKVTKESGISLVNKHIMEKKETNKVTKTAKMEAKTTSRGEKCLVLDQGNDRCKQFMEKKIFKQYIDLDKMSRKEMNFKSKLIEWSQKHKVEVSFELIEQFIDRENNPMFQTEVQIEGLPAGTGTGYSKKESQQNAAQMALKKLKSDETFKSEIERLKTEHQATLENTNKPLTTDEIPVTENIETEASSVIVEIKVSAPELPIEEKQETTDEVPCSSEISSYPKQTPI